MCPRLYADLFNYAQTQTESQSGTLADGDSETDDEEDD